MPRKAKKARQAEAQRALGLRFFDRGFVDEIKEYTLDPSYEPTPDELAEDSDNDGSESGWAFSMVEGTCTVDDNDSDSGWEDDDEINSLQTSSCKRRATSKPESDDEIEVIDLEEEAAVRAAESAQQWRDFFKNVRNQYLN
jgi:hypothetical protein